MYFFQEAIDALFVDPLRRFQQIEVNANGSREVNECLHIFRKAKAPRNLVPALRKLAANPGIQSHRVSHLFYVRTQFFHRDQRSHLHS